MAKPALLEQLQKLRTPIELRTAPQANKLDQYLSNVRENLQSMSSAGLANGGNDKAPIDLLETLSPSLDTLPYLYVLLAQISKTSAKQRQQLLSSGAHLWQKLRAFIEGFDPIEIRYAGQSWADLMNVLASIPPQAQQDSNTVNASMTLMAVALTRIDPSAGTFTSSHLTFLRACLSTHSFQEATHIIDFDIHSFPPKQCPQDTFLCSPHHLSNGYMTLDSKLVGGPNLQDAQEYQLLSAMVYIGLHNWSEAQYHLENVLCTPTTNTANALMLEAYKKWLLVSLLVNGKPTPLPKAASGNAMKTLRSAAKPYGAVLDAFKLNAPHKLRAEVHDASGLFQEDGNLGLVQHVVAHHQKLFVMKFADIYAAVPITMIAPDLSMSNEEAESYISSLIAEGLLHADVEAPTDGGSSVIRFAEASRHVQDMATEEKLRNELVAQAARIKALDVHIAEADHRLALTREYSEHVSRARKAKQEQKEHGDVEAAAYGQMGMVGPGMGIDDEENENVMIDDP